MPACDQEMSDRSFTSAAALLEVDGRGATRPTTAPVALLGDEQGGLGQ